MKNTLIIFAVLFSLTACTTAPVDKPADQEEKSSNSKVQSSDTKTNSNNNTKKMVKIDKENFEDLAKEYTGVVFKTNLGDFELKLYSEKSPITVNNFLNLAKNDFYDDVKFHRVIKNFMIQAGDPLSKDDAMKNRWGTGGPGYAIEDEFIEGLSNTRGTISMANSGPNSGGSQFFINVIDNARLDWDKEPSMSKHPVFGEVVKGMNVVDEISNAQTIPGDKPSSDIIIKDIELLK
jgi:peptidylprolyl isomerase